MTHMSQSMRKFANQPWSALATTGYLVLSDGLVIAGHGLGATGQAVGEVCFNTAMTGYQEILSDPSYAGQIITFTFPHIGNVGTNDEDMETANPAGVSGVRGVILRDWPGEPSNYRARNSLDTWLKRRNIIAICGVDTRALTSHIREHGLANAIIAHAPGGDFDLAALKAEATAWAGIEGADLATEISTSQTYGWDAPRWQWDKAAIAKKTPKRHVVVVDYGAKTNILRVLADLGCQVTVVSATASAAEILGHKPDGVMLTNGPGDPAATGTHALKVIRAVVDTGLPVFGICLGHQLLALALGATTKKMHQGHHGANHPVFDTGTGKVEITSMNHGFAVDGDSLPPGVEQTHKSLFDGTNCGLKMVGKPVFSVQHHPEASPGPKDAGYLFERFIKLIDQQEC
ncbi:MAG: glutamine-hydrolyzing carbamoyl-phosphate synthase small subunit [Alphaproteobacteria bacterium]